MDILQSPECFFIKGGVDAFPNQVIQRHFKGIGDFFSRFNGWHGFAAFILADHLPGHAAVSGQFCLIPVFLFAKVTNDFTCIYLAEWDYRLFLCLIVPKRFFQKNMHMAELIIIDTQQLQYGNEVYNSRYWAE